jgi:hypothetical protein
MKPDRLYIEGHESLVRDKNSNAILNTDLSALAKYKASRRSRMDLERKVNEIDTIKEELAEVKMLLRQLVDRENR